MSSLGVNKDSLPPQKKVIFFKIIAFLTTLRGRISSDRELAFDGSQEPTRYRSIKHSTCY